MPLVKYNLINFRLIQCEINNSLLAQSGVPVNIAPAARVSLKNKGDIPFVLVELHIDVNSGISNDGENGQGILTSSFDFQASYEFSSSLDHNDAKEIIERAQVRYEVSNTSMALAMKDIRNILNSTGLNTAGMPYSFGITDSQLIGSA